MVLGALALGHSELGPLDDDHAARLILNARQDDTRPSNALFASTFHIPHPAEVRPPIEVLVSPRNMPSAVIASRLALDGHTSSCRQQRTWGDLKKCREVC